MWILEYIPAGILHWLMIAGGIGLIASFLLNFVPRIAAYRTLIQVVSVLLLCFGLWIEGGLAEKAKWEVKVADAEKRVKEAEAKSGQVNVQVVEKIVYRDKIIREKGDTITQYVDREVTKYDSTCPIPESVVKALNAAALNVTVEELPTK